MSVIVFLKYRSAKTTWFGNKTLATLRVIGLRDLLIFAQNNLLRNNA